MRSKLDQACLWYYNKVYCLERDLDLFKEYRDENIVEDRRIILSGGQKAWVSLARAIYNNRETILLDNPLSVVYPEVSSNLCNNCKRNTLQIKE